MPPYKLLVARIHSSRFKRQGPPSTLATQTGPKAKPGKDSQPKGCFAGLSSRVQKEKQRNMRILARCLGHAKRCWMQNGAFGNMQGRLLK